MSDTDWGLIWETFEGAAALPEATRAGWLDARCGTDGPLRSAVEELLRADAEPSMFFDRPVVSVAGSEGATQRDGRSAPVPLPGELPKGARLGPYRILRRIGQGGMSVVYLAVRDDGAFERRVVLKLVRPGMESAEVEERLRTERRILAGLEHPNIARLYDGGSTPEGAPFFVMEHVDGEPIDHWCDHHGLSIDERLTLVRKVCRAVNTAHQNLVVHRDLKPSNILVDRDGEPKLLDFGIAKLLNPGLSGTGLEPTQTVHRLLTPSYASPEQVSGRAITTASDVYSLGVVLYKLLTGCLPRSFEGCSVAEIDRLLHETEPTPPSQAVAEAQGAGERRRQLSGDLDAIVLKSLRSAPRQRYGSVEQLAADLERYQLGLPVKARAGNWRYQAGKFIRRHRRVVSATAAAALLLLGFAVSSVVQSRSIALQHAQVRSERDQKAQVLSLIEEIFRHSSPYTAPGEELTVRQVLDRSLPALERSLVDQPDVRAELLHTTGKILLEIGHPEIARERLQHALVLREALLGPEHPEVAVTLISLASATKLGGFFQEAEELARRALAIARRQPELQDGSWELTTEALNQLVSVLCYQGDTVAALSLAEEALERTAWVGAHRGQRIVALELLALTLSNEGDHRRPARLNREALALRRLEFGDDHPGQITTLHNLSSDLRQLGNQEGAAFYHRASLEVLEAGFKGNRVNPSLFYGLALSLAEQGEVDLAQDLFRRAGDTIRQTNPDDWSVLAYAHEEALLDVRRGEAARAEAALWELQAQWRPRLDGHWQLEVGDNMLGETLSVQGRCAEAEAMLVESFDKLLAVPRTCVRRAALLRLADHFERCRGDRTAAAPFAARLEARIATEV